MLKRNISSYLPT